MSCGPKSMGGGIEEGVEREGGGNMLLHQNYHFRAEQS